MLTERLIQNLPKLPRKEWLMTKSRQFVSSIKTTVTRWGLLGLLLLIMVIASSLKLLWSNNFPIGWWIIISLLIINEIVKDKILWQKEKNQLKRLESESQKEEKSKEEVTK